MNADDYYQVESTARRDGYDWEGDDGLPLPKKNGGIGGRWQGLPTILTPFFDIDGIVEQAKHDLPDVSVERSDDASPMYCGFLFYTSLAELYRRGAAARALFLHHAGKKTDEAGTKEGAQVAVSVVCSMIDQLSEVA